MFSLKPWNSTKFVRLELTVKTLALFKHGGNKLNSMSQNKKMSPILSRSDFSMIWRYNGIPSAHFYLFIFLCLEPMARKDTWMTTTSITVIVIFSKVAF